VLAQETDGGDTGELHCYVGAIGIALVVLSLVGGFLSSGRFGRIKGWKPGRYHYPVTVITAVYLTGEFALGMMKLGWSLLINVHLILGIGIPVLAWLSVLLSPCLSGKLIAWKASSKIHAALGFLLILLVIFQVLYAYLIMGG
jgi:hypothetical protein